MLFFNCLHTDRCTILSFEIPNGFRHIYYGWNLFMDIKIGKITFHFQMCVNTMQNRFQNAIQSHHYLSKFNLFFNHEVRKFSIELSEKFFKWGLCSNWAKKGKSIYSLLSTYALLSHPFLHIYQYTIFGEISKGCFLK